MMVSFVLVPPTRRHVVSRAVASITNNNLRSTRQRQRFFFSTITKLDQTSSSTDDHHHAAASLETMPEDVAQLVHEYTQKQQSPASLKWLLKTGQGELTGHGVHDEAFLGKMGRRLATERILMQMATFVRQELPIRLAHRILDLNSVPLMRDMPSVQAVKQVYMSSFLELLQQPPMITDAVMEAKFATTLELLYQKHSNVLLQMARGAYELRQAIRDQTISTNGNSNNNSSSSSNSRFHTTPSPQQRARQDQTTIQELIWNRNSDVHMFLDKFYMSRIGIRVLAGQYLALRNPSPPPGYIGMIYQHTSPKESVERAAHDATFMCHRKYGEAPEVVVQGQLDLTFPYIPAHLHYILLELLKNAMRATTEQHQLYDKDNSCIPPVTVIIADGTDNEDVVIKIMDEGGGIPRSQVENIWSYLFTTADASIQDAFIKNHQDHSQQSPIAGLGYGLPISRSYARYFGGDLDIMSMEGYGTDAYVHLVRLGDSPEPLPI